jgi:hypothetical protein
MMVMVRSRNDLDHEVNGQRRNASQRRAHEELHFTSNPAIGSLLLIRADPDIRYYQIIRSLSRDIATVKRLVKGNLDHIKVTSCIQ